MKIGTQTNILFLHSNAIGTEPSVDQDNSKNNKNENQTAR